MPETEARDLIVKDDKVVGAMAHSIASFSWRIPSVGRWIKS